MSHRNRRASTSDLKVKFEKECRISLSARTVQRRFAECGLLVYRLKKKLLLTKTTTATTKDAEETFLRKTACFMDKGPVGLGNFF